MNLKQRYCFLSLVIFSLVITGYYIIGHHQLSSTLTSTGVHRRSTDHTDYQFYVQHEDERRNYVGADEEQTDMHVSPSRRREQVITNHRSLRNCRMSTCFDFDLCKNGFKVYIYPPQDKVSSNYREVLNSLASSRYFTQKPEEACLFILSIDTLDRDKLSELYVQDIQLQIDGLSLWNSGRNHLIFNLYSGTWPDYNENGLGFDIGYAMLAKASISEVHYRPNFDISFPLFHKEHSSRGGEAGYLVSNSVPPIRQYTLSFKGKRYLAGIGSETRNSLYHLHDGKDMILLTTCKHGKGWKNLVDARCATDNEEYDRWDYKVLLHNSTFCLVPRGRRLGSYRFLESLQAGCIPVLLSNNWVLPFSEVIDWNKALIWADERLLFQVPTIIRFLHQSKILAMRQQTQFLWETYFSSIEKIVSTTLEIVKDRIDRYMPRTSFVWNSIPGALAVLPRYSLDLEDFPFYWRTVDSSVGDRFTALIYCRSSTLATGLHRLVKALGQSSYLDMVIFLWHNTSHLPHRVTWPLHSQVPVVNKVIQSVDEKFTYFPEIRTSAIFSLDCDVQLVPDEIDFAFHVWRHFPERLVGYPAYSHYWDDGHQLWKYSSKWTNDYSMILTSASIYHRYYGYLYSHWLPEMLHKIIHQLQSCEDILMNFLISHVTKAPPIKTAQRRFLKNLLLDRQLASARLTQKHYCINRFVKEFGYMPLIRSALRLDPVFFKDRVAVRRKKYRQIEQVT